MPIKLPAKEIFYTTVRVIREMAIVVGLYLLGELLVSLLESSFPGSIVGMLILLSLLHLGWIKVENIRLVSSLLLAYMPLFFIPAGVSVMTTYTLMDGFYWQIILLTMVSTVLVMVVTAKSVEYFIKREHHG